MTRSTGRTSVRGAGSAAEQRAGSQAAVGEPAAEREAEAPAEEVAVPAGERAEEAVVPAGERAEAGVVEAVARGPAAAPAPGRGSGRAPQAPLRRRAHRSRLRGGGGARADRLLSLRSVLCRYDAPPARHGRICTMPPKNTSPSMRRRENITGFSRRGTLELARKAAKSTLAARLRAASVRTRAAPVACSRKRGMRRARAPRSGTFPPSHVPRGAR